MRNLLCLTYCLLSMFSSSAFAQASAQESAQESPLVGNWLVNEELSEATDDKVEIALLASGQKSTRGFFNRNKEYYRGGPVEQELYDFISYEKTLSITLNATEYTFVYGEFVRPVYLDNRGTSVSLSSINELEDFSFANWESDVLVVEGRPRDGGFTDQRYTLSEDGRQLSVQLYIQPQSLRAPVELLRVYDRLPDE